MVSIVAPSFQWSSAQQTDAKLWALIVSVLDNLPDSGLKELFDRLDEVSEAEQHPKETVAASSGGGGSGSPGKIPCLWQLVSAGLEWNAAKNLANSSDEFWAHVAVRLDCTNNEKLDYPSDTDIAKIAKALGATPDELLAGMKSIRLLIRKHVTGLLEKHELARSILFEP